MKTDKEFTEEKNKELLKSYGVTNFTNENIIYICKYGKQENIKLMKGQDFTNNNVRDICEYGIPEKIKLMEGQDYTNDNIRDICNYLEPYSLIKYLLANKDKQGEK